MPIASSVSRQCKKTTTRQTICYLKTEKNDIMNSQRTKQYICKPHKPTHDRSLQKRWLKTDSVFSVEVNEINLKKKYFCVITNDSVSKYLYSGFLRLNCIDYLTTDTFQLVEITKEEALNEHYLTTVLESEKLKSGSVSDLSVTLISPWKVRGRQQWQGSIDKSSWVDLSATMPTSALKTNIVAISET